MIMEKDLYMKKIMSFFLVICIIMSTTTIFPIVVSAEGEKIVKVKVTATDKGTGEIVPVDDASVNMYMGQGTKGDNVEWKASSTTQNGGYAEFDLSGYTDEEIAKLTFSASKTIASGKGVDGPERDPLFNVYQEDRLQLELHSEFIDSNGNWKGKKLPSGNGKDVDLAFVVDVSGSMQSTIDNVKNNICTFSNYLANQGLNLRIAVIEYNSYQNDTYVYGINKIEDELHHSVWMSNVSDMEKILDTMRATGGGDEIPIDGLGYLLDTSTMKWRSSAHKFAFLLTDEASNNNSNNRWGYTKMQDIANDLLEEGVTTSVVMEDKQSFEKEYGPLYNTTGGQKVNIFSSDFSEEMIKLANGIIETAEKGIELHLNEPRMLVDMSVCYYADDKKSHSDDYYNKIKDKLKQYSLKIANATDGHVLINKVYMFNTDNRENFYAFATNYTTNNDGDSIIEIDSTNTPTSAMADIRIESDEKDSILGKKTMIHSNAHILGFFSTCVTPNNINEDRYKGISKDELYILSHKVQLPRIQFGFYDKASDTELPVETIAHESGHYILGLFDEYLNGNEEDWSEDKPHNAPHNFGLMEYQYKNIELSKKSDYDYLGIEDNRFDDPTLNSLQSFRNGMSCEEYLADLLCKIPILTDYNITPQGNYEIKYTLTDLDVDPDSHESIDKTAEYPYAELTDDNFIDLRNSENWKNQSRATSLSEELTEILYEEKVESTMNLANLTAKAEGDIVKIHINQNMGDDLNLYMKTAGDSTESNITEIQVTDQQADIPLANGSSCELIVIVKQGNEYLYNLHILERSLKSNKGYYYQSSDMTVEGYVIPDSEDEYTFMTVGSGFEEGEYIAVNNPLRIQSTNQSNGRGEIYSVASVDDDIDYTTISWFKYDDGQWKRISTDLSEEEDINKNAVYSDGNNGGGIPLDTDLSVEENMNIGARCDYAGDGTYVLMAKRASNDTMQKISDIQYTNPTWKDGIANLTFIDMNPNTKYYNIYYSKDSFTSLDGENITMQKYNAGLDYYPINIGGYDTDAYISVVAVADNGAKSEPSDIIRVNTGQADRDGDGIPDWYCDKYLLWPESGVEKDIANSDKDRDGLTNLQEYENGSDPSDPNDPVQNIAVESISLDQKNVTLKPGETVVLTASILPSDAANKDVEWHVDDSSKVTIEPDGLGCKVTGISEGSAKVTAVTLDGGYTATADITVSDRTEQPSVSSINLNTREVTLKPGDTYTLTADILPVNAANKNVEWHVDDHSKATIEQDGLRCKVTAVSEGATKVRVMSADGGYMATVDIIVASDKAETPEKKLQKLKNKYGVGNKKVERAVGSKLTQKVTGAKTTITFESSDPKVAKVGKTSGVITCVGVGKAVITTRAAESSQYKAASKKATIYVIPKTAKIKSIRSNKKGKVTIKSSKTTKGNDGYQIQYKHDGKTKKVKVKSHKSLTKTFKNLKSRKAFKVRIRAYKKVGSMTYYGKYSKWKAVKKVK